MSEVWSWLTNGAMTERINVLAERINVSSSIGVLADILQTLRFRSTIFMRSRLAAPWGFSFEEEPATRFHISVSGRFFVGDENVGPPVAVDEMEIVILPSGGTHWIADVPGTPRMPSAKASEACELGTSPFQNGSITNLVMCGVTRFDADLSHPFLEALPALIHLPELDERSPIWRLVGLIDTEAERGSSLGTPILDRLTEALFLQLLQEVVENGEETIGFVGAMREPTVRQALELLHKEPATAWTVDDLAVRVAASRATLIRRFRKEVGMPPIEYLTQWRLVKAHQLARYSSDSVERIASRVGFSSAQTLTRSFKRFFGVTPSSLRG